MIGAIAREIMTEIQRAPMASADLCVALGVSAVTVRVALEELVSRDLADSRPRSDRPGDEWFAVEGAVLPPARRLPPHSRAPHRLRSWMSLALLRMLESGPRTAGELGPRPHRVLLELYRNRRVRREIAELDKQRSGRKRVYRYSITDLGRKELEHVANAGGG